MLLALLIIPFPNQGLCGQGKSGENISFSRWSGKVRENQGKSGNSTKKSGKTWKKSGKFFGKFLPPMNQDPLFILAVVCQTSLTSYFSLYLDIFLL